MNLIEKQQTAIFIGNKLMQEEHRCEYCGSKDANIVIYYLGPICKPYDIYLCKECERKELEDLNG